MVKNSSVSAGDARDLGLIHGLRISPGGGDVNRCQCSCWDDSAGRGSWWDTVHGIVKSCT